MAVDIRKRYLHFPFYPQIFGRVPFEMNRRLGITIVGFVGPPSGILRYTREKIEARVTIITLINKNLLAVGCCVRELASLKFVLFSTKFRFSFAILSDNPQTKYKHFVQADNLGCSNVDSK